MLLLSLLEDERKYFAICTSFKNPPLRPSTPSTPSAAKPSAAAIASITA